MLHRSIQQTLDDIVVELATASDAPELAELFQRFFDEAGYKQRGIVYHPDKAEASLARVIENGDYPHIVARSKGVIIGAISYSLDDTFSEPPFAVLNTFYVEPAHRKSAVGAMLLGLACECAQVDGAVAFHAPVASEMAETASLQNLLIKAGFDPVGFIMARRL
jgi:L-amino acid N-acyltransferase YncA